MKKLLYSTIALLGMAGLAPAAHAGGSFGFSIGLSGGGVSTYGSYCAPAAPVVVCPPTTYYYTPPVTYYYSDPVYYTPAPAYYAPAYAYSSPAYYYSSAYASPYYYYGPYGSLNFSYYSGGYYGNYYHNNGWDHDNHWNGHDNHWNDHDNHWNDHNDGHWNDHNSHNDHNDHNSNNHWNNSNDRNDRNDRYSNNRDRSNLSADRGQFDRGRNPAIVRSNDRGGNDRQQFNQPTQRFEASDRDVRGGGMRTSPYAQQGIIRQNQDSGRYVNPSVGDTRGADRNQSMRGNSGMQRGSDSGSRGQGWGGRGSSGRHN